MALPCWKCWSPNKNTSPHAFTNNILMEYVLQNDFQSLTSFCYASLTFYNYKRNVKILQPPSTTHNWTALRKIVLHFWIALSKHLSFFLNFIFQREKETLWKIVPFIVRAMNFNAKWGLMLGISMKTNVADAEKSLNNDYSLMSEHYYKRTRRVYSLNW